MQVSIRQLRLLAVLILAFLPVWVDTFYGVVSYLGFEALKVSLLYRLALLAAGLYLVLSSRHWLSYAVFALVLFWSLIFWYNSTTTGEAPLVQGVTHVTRLIFPFCMALLVLCVVASSTRLRDLLLRGLAHYGWVFGVFVIFSFITGIGLLSYGDHAFGVKSFYVAGNDIGLTALMSLIVQFAMLYRQFNWPRLGGIVLTLIGLLLLGTKTSWAGSVLVVGFFLVAFLFFKPVHGKKGLSAKVVVFSFGAVIAAGTVQFIHTNYEQLQFQLNQFAQIAAGKSPRAELVRVTDDVFSGAEDKAVYSGLGQRFYRGVSEGYYQTYQKSDPTTVEKYVEADWHDLRGAYGIPFATFVFLLHWALLGILLWRWLLSPDILLSAYLVILTLFNAHAFLAGHAYMSSQVGGFVGMIYGLLLVSLMERRWLPAVSSARS